MKMNPFAALDVDADDGARNRRVRTSSSLSSNATGDATRRRGRRNAETKRAVLLEAALLEAKRNAAHAAMEARETTNGAGTPTGETWGKVGKGSGIKRSEAKKMAAALNSTRVKDGKVDATAANADANDARNTTTTTTTVEKKSGVVTDETSTSSTPPPVVSDVYKHVFEDTGATAWCVDVTDGIDRTVTRMSVTKAVPRMRKVSFKEKTTVVLAEEETTAVVRLWEEETRIDRARRAKARRKAAAKEAKEAQEAQEAQEAVAVSSTTQTVVDENPPEPVVVPSRPAAPPGFERAPMYSPTPPGFSKPAYGAQPAVRYVPIVDPNLEARQRQLEAQVAMLQAQLAAQANVGAAPARRAPPGFEANVENSSSTGGGKYVPPGRRR